MAQLLRQKEEMTGTWSCFRGIRGLEGLAEIKGRGTMAKKGALL